VDNIEKVKNSLDIVDVVSKYLDLKSAGSNYKGLCPFHNEKTPSFMVNPSLQIFKCFGCGKGGDVLNFIQEVEHLPFNEALDLGAEMGGVEIEKSYNTDPKEKANINNALRAHELAAKYYNHILTSHNAGNDGRKYAQKRGIEKSQIEEFKVGFSPKNKNNLKLFLKQKGFEEKDLINWGLLANQQNEIIDKFRYRLLQPIFSLKGEVVGFSGRYIDKSDYAPKYLNSPETIIFKKQESLYSLYHAKEAIRKEGFVILVEGNIDILSSFKVGVRNIVAPLGTAFTKPQAKLLKRYCDTIYFCFDSDSAGMQALIRSLGIVEEVGLKHKVLALGEYQDADELINDSAQTWKKIISKPIDTFEYIRGEIAKEIDLGTADGKRTFQSKIMPILRLFQDKAVQYHYAREVALILDVPQDVIESKLEEKNTLRFNSYEETVEIKPNLNSDKVERNELEQYLLSIVIQHKMTHILDMIPDDLFLNPNCIKLAKKLNKTKKELTVLTHDVLGDLWELYGELATYDLTHITDPEEEVDKIYNRLYVEYVKHKILSLRRAIALEDDNENLLKELQELTEELKSIA
jgi:DNA primase